MLFSSKKSSLAPVFSYYRLWQTLWHKRLQHSCFWSSSEISQANPSAGKRCPLKVRDVTVKYDKLGLYSPDCFTGELQPHTLEVLRDPKKVFFNHKPVVENTYLAITTVKRFINFLERKQFLRLYKTVTKYRVFTIRPKIRQRNWNTTNRSTQIEQREGLLQKNGQTLFELVRRIQHLDVFMKNLIRAEADLVESTQFRRQRTAISEKKIGLLQSLDLYH